MVPLKTISIIGGGLAGLTLGIGLRQRGIPVVIWEAGRYPRHRVCGEFISGRGQETLQRLGLIESIVSSGTRSARTVSFCTESSASKALVLPQPAICISRHDLDERLAREFRRLGGELRESSRWREQTLAEGTVRATGRRIHPVANGWRWFGLKVHAAHVTLRTDLEMHFTRQGYVGVCRLNGKVNICGLFRSRAPDPHILSRWREYFQGTPGSWLRQSCANAVFDDDSFCSVAGLSYEPWYESHRSECAIGDALTMIPPIAGNGMSMAFEAAELAMEPLERFSHARLSWSEAQHAVRRNCTKTFRSRLLVAHLVQKVLFCSALLSGFTRSVHFLPHIFSSLFLRTR